MKHKKDYTDGIRKILMDRLDTIGDEDTLDMLSVEYAIVQLNDFINQILISNERETVRKHEQKWKFCSSCISNKPNNAICDFCNSKGSKYKKAK
jgi:hypothetical protein